MNWKITLLFLALALAGCLEDDSVPLETSEGELTTCPLVDVVYDMPGITDCRYDCGPAFPAIGLFIDRDSTCPATVCVETSPEGGTDWCGGVDPTPR